jgi:hypothetical protein
LKSENFDRILKEISVFLLVGLSPGKKDNPGSIKVEKLLTVWAVDFETPVGSSTFFSVFFSWAAPAERNN